MGFTPLENSISPDDWTVSWDHIPESDAEKTSAVKRVEKDWTSIKSDLNGVVDLSYTKPDFKKLVDQLAPAKSHAVIFELKLTKTEIRLDVEVGNTTVKAGAMKVPSDLEDYRDLLKSLNNFSTGDRTIVSNSDLKKFNEANPKKPTWKTFDELTRGGTKDDMAAFHTWAKSKPKAKAALEAYDNAKKPADKTNAAKAVDPFYKDWLKTF